MKFPLTLLVSGLWLMSGSATVLAQRPLVQQFSASTVYLSAGDTLVGPATLRADQDVLVLTMPDRTLRTVTPVGVDAVALCGEQTPRGILYSDIYDFQDARRGYYAGNPYRMPPVPQPQRADTTIVRLFKVFRWNRSDNSDFLTLGFFEQLSLGPVMLLRRELLVSHPSSPYDPHYWAYTYGAMPRGPVGYYTDIQDSFFLGLPNGKVVRLRNPKKDLLSFFRSDARDIDLYARNNKLNYENARQLAYIVNYANSLRRSAD